MRQAVSNAEDSQGGSSFARFDQACLDLFQRGKTDRLPGAFLGRVCKIAQVIGMDSAAAVNAVAKETVNLVSCCCVHIVYPVDAPIYTLLSIFCALTHRVWARQSIGALNMSSALTPRLSSNAMVGCW